MAPAASQGPAEILGLGGVSVRANIWSLVQYVKGLWFKPTWSLDRLWLFRNEQPATWNTHICTHVHRHTCTQTYMCAHTHMHAHTCTNTTRTNTHTPAHTQRHTHARTHAHARLHTQTHTRTQQTHTCTSSEHPGREAGDQVLLLCRALVSSRPRPSLLPFTVPATLPTHSSPSSVGLSLASWALQKI